MGKSDSDAKLLRQGNCGRKLDLSPELGDFVLRSMAANGGCRNDYGLQSSPLKARNHMKANCLHAMLLGVLCQLAFAQSGPASLPLDGDWEGVLVFQGADYHMVLHMNTTPEGKITALLDHTDHEKSSGMPAIGGSFDGSHVILRFNYWKPNSNRDLERKVASYEATVNPSSSEMSGVWTQEGSWPVNFKRLTWRAKISKPAHPPFSTAIGRAWRRRGEVSNSTLSFISTTPRTA